ncbi:MAG: hypothetical protein PVI75_07850 [Gammaproteobacteria bacterium]
MIIIPITLKLESCHPGPSMLSRDPVPVGCYFLDSGYFPASKQGQKNSGMTASICLRQQ